MNIVFHGSHIPGFRLLSARHTISFYNNQPVIYGTKDYFYALIRAGRFGTRIPYRTIREEYHGTEQPIELVEIYKDAFEWTFDTPGSIYLIDDRYFEKVDNEWISYCAMVPIIGEIEIRNIWDEIRTHPDRFKLIRYGTKEAEDYWKAV